MLALDHLVIGARTLEEGAQWVLDHLGAMPAGGGKHALMSTHNRLLGLGDQVYLEVLAIDPEAPPPSRPRWFGLDTPEMHERLERGPSLIHWVVRTDDIERDARSAPVHLGEILDVTRGEYRWRITVPRDGNLPRAGIFPTLIQWQGNHPSAALPDSTCRLQSLALSHPRGSGLLAALRLLGLPPDAPVSATDADPGLVAHLHTADNVALIT